MHDSATELVNTLRSAGEGGEIRIAVDGNCYEGEVTRSHYEPAETHGGAPCPGRLTVGIELTNESLEQTDAPSHQVTIRADERRPGSWEVPEATAYDPVVDNGVLVEENFVVLGAVQAVDRLGGEQR